jgi:hypothetical protein
LAIACLFFGSLTYWALEFNDIFITPATIEAEPVVPQKAHPGTKYSSVVQHLGQRRLAKLAIGWGAL